MNWKLRTFALFMGLNFLPTLAAGDTTADTPAVNLVDLTRAEVEQTFKNFSAGRVRGTRTARLYGTVFADCLDHFTFTTVEKDGTHAGWRIQDTGTRGRECMRGHQTDSCVETAEGNTCVSLSASPRVPVLNARPRGAMEAGIITVNPNADVNDPNRVAFTSFEPALNFTNPVAEAHSEQAESEESRRRRCRLLREQIRTCRDDREELAIARAALRELVSESDECGDVNESAMDRISRQLDRQELALLEREVRRARIDDLGEVADKVMDFANSHSDEDEDSDYATAAAHLMRTIAMRYVRARNADEDSFADARDVLEKALELDGLSETNVSRLEGYLDDLDVAETAYMCRSGDQFECQPAFQSLMADLQQQAWESCNGWNIDQQRCQSAMMQMQRAPGQIQQVFQQRQQMQHQFFAGGGNTAGGGTLLPGSQGFQFGTPMGYQQNPFLAQSTMAMNPYGMSQFTGYNPTASLVMNGSGAPMMPPMSLPVASI